MSEENKTPNVEIISHGLQCDHCDWSDETIPMNDYKSWINAPCPKCGENLLTQEDFDLTDDMTKITNIINSLSEEQLEDLAKGKTNEEILGILSKDVAQNGGVVEPNIDPDKKVMVTITAHKKIQITELKGTTDDNSENKT